jgi:methylphosphotriester-DNA--protein-cysteine methyltransferase
MRLAHRLRRPALEYLDLAADSGFGLSEWIAGDSDLKSLHGDPRFEAILAKARSDQSKAAMSPLQYQKMIRLQEARRLLVIENHGATEVAYSVGMKAPSQFTRKYAPQFGSPPARDAARL